MARSILLGEEFSICVDAASVTVSGSERCESVSESSQKLKAKRLASPSSVSDISTEVGLDDDHVNTTTPNTDSESNSEAGESKSKTADNVTVTSGAVGLANGVKVDGVKVDFVCLPLTEAFSDSGCGGSDGTQNTPLHSFDIMDLSNVGDWLSLAEYKKLLKEVLRDEGARSQRDDSCPCVLNKGGKLVLRRLLGDYRLEELLEQVRCELGPGIKLSVSLVKNEGSLFYSETVVVTKVV